MAQTAISTQQGPNAGSHCPANQVIAAGLFGYSIANGHTGVFFPKVGFIREIEQMPNFAPPSASKFVAQYIRNNIS